jgi:hypothetical protein
MLTRVVDGVTTTFAHYTNRAFTCMKQAGELVDGFDSLPLFGPCRSQPDLIMENDQVRT